MTIQKLAVKQIFLESWELVKRFRKEVFVFVLLSTILSQLETSIASRQSSFSPSALIPYFIASSVLSSFMSMVFIYLIDQKVNGHHIDLLAAIKKSSERFLPILGVTFLVSFFILLGLIALIIPGLIIYIVTSQAYFLVLFEKKDPWSATKESFELTKGHRLQIFKICIAYAFLLLIVKLITKPLAAFDVLVLTAFLIFYSLLQYSIWRALRLSKS